MTASSPREGAITSAANGLEDGPTGSGAPAPKTQAIDVDQVSLHFGAVKALTDVTFTIAPRTIHSIIGPNGAGKSTLLNVLSGVYRPTSGRVMLGDTDLTVTRPHQIARLGVARAFQNLALSERSSVLDNLFTGRHHLMRAGMLSCALGLPPQRREERRHRERIDEIARYLHIDTLLDTPVGDLSYGDQKRVEIARALCMEPTVLLLDEPVAGMNAGESRSITTMLRRLRDQLDLTIVLVEHDMEMVMGLSDHVTVLNFGRRTADGRPDEVRDDPEVITAYLGADVDAEATTGAAAVGVAE